MSEVNGAKPVEDGDDDEFEVPDYDDMETLEILETIREDMEDLGVTTLEEVIQRIEALHQKLDKKG